MTELSAAFSLVVSLLVMAGIWSWAFALRKLILRQPLLAYEPRNRPLWSILDIFMTVVFMIALQGAAGILLGFVDSSNLDAAAHSAEGLVTDSVVTRWAIGLSGVASLLACGLAGLLIVLRTGTRWGQDLGLTLRHARRDVAYGSVAFAMLAPIIYTIQLILVQWYPSEHPLIESFRANPTLAFFLVCVFSAAIVAPMVEEFVCRVLLQGWLERVLTATSVAQALFPAQEQERPPPDPSAITDSNPYLPPTSMNEAECEEASSTHRQPAESPGTYRGAISILISSLVFAGLHWSHGPDPIPLFVLALGLGYLYQRTHRILPCVVLHFLVNAFSLAVLALSLVAE